MGSLSNLIGGLLVRFLSGRSWLFYEVGWVINSAAKLSKRGLRPSCFAFMAILISVGPAFQAHAGISSNDLQKYCARKGSGGYTYCIAYLNGAIEMFRKLRNADPRLDHICVQATELSPDARREMYFEWSVRNNNSAPSMDAPDAIIQALSEAFPCQKDNALPSVSE